MFTGGDFTLIEKPVDYKNHYAQTAGKFTHEYGIYDVSSIRRPFIENGKAVFFAEKNSSGVPYKVFVTFPFNDCNAECSYTLLPQWDRR